MVSNETTTTTTQSTHEQLVTVINGLSRAYNVSVSGVKISKGDEIQVRRTLLSSVISVTYEGAVCEVTVEGASTCLLLCLSTPLHVKLIDCLMDASE